MYASLNQLKAYIPNYTASTASDALLTDCLNRAKAAIDQHCGRTFEAAADTTRHFDTLRDVDGLTLFLDHDLCQITSITNGDGTTITSGQYVMNPRNETPWHAIRLKLSAGKLWLFQTDPEDAIAITGRWAYSVAAPDDIVQAGLRLAAYFYKQRDAQVFDVTADIARGQMTLPKGIPADVKQLLATYVRLA